MRLSATPRANCKCICTPEFDTKRAKCLISLETAQKFPLQQAQLRIRHGLSDVHRRQQVSLLAVNIGDA